MSTSILETQRLRLRRLRDEDAPFILDLLNQPSFLEHIGDKGVRDLNGAREYIRQGPAATHEAHGYGLDLVMHKASDDKMGICGLVRRDTLDHPDLGYAFLPSFWRNGYALEAARGVLTHARDRLGIGRILAIVSPENAASIRLLEKVGFALEATTALAEGEPPIQRFVIG